MRSIDGLKVLFADDEKYYMRPTIDALESRGARIALVETGTDVLKFLARNTEFIPDLIILDIMMPSGTDIKTKDSGRSTGVEVYRVIRDHPVYRGIPIIILTVVTDRASLQVFNNDELTRKIQKPFMVSKLIESMVCLVSKATKKQAIIDNITNMGNKNGSIA